MALISCPECGHKVSDQAEACPACAYPIQKHIQEEAKKAAHEKTLEYKRRQAEAYNESLKKAREEREAAANVPAPVAETSASNKKAKLLRCLAIAMAVVAVVILTLFYLYQSTPKAKIKAFLEERGLTNVTVETYPHHLETAGKYSTHYYSTDIYCDGYSKLLRTQVFNIFTTIDSMGTNKTNTDWRYITIYSDGGVYTYNEEGEKADLIKTVYLNGEEYYSQMPNAKQGDSSIPDAVKKAWEEIDKTARHSDLDAYIIAKEIVKGSLKSPSSAKFCSSSEVTVSNSGNSYTVTGWVEAQNSYGAMLKQDFIVTYDATQSGENIGYKNAEVLIF